MSGKLVDILYDPYSKHAAFDVKKHPPGRRLSWKSKQRLNEKGGDGWFPVKKGDGIYEKLSEYINESPLKFIQSTDTTVERGQNILCWKPLGSWLARKIENAKKSNILKQHQAAMAGMQEHDPWGPGPQVLSSKKDPTDVVNIMEGYGIAPSELDCPEADPRNYVPADIANQVVIHAGEVVLAGDVEPSDPSPASKRGRPRKK